MVHIALATPVVAIFIIVAQVVAPKDTAALTDSALLTGAADSALLTGADFLTEPALLTEPAEPAALTEPAVPTHLAVCAGGGFRVLGKSSRCRFTALMKLNRRIVLVNCASAALYLASAGVISGLGKYPGSLSSAPPELGVAVAVAVIFGLRGLPGVTVGALASVVLGKQPWVVCVVLPLSVSGSAALAARWLRRVKFDARMRRVSDVLSFLWWGAAIPSSIISVMTLALMVIGRDGDFSGFAATLFAGFAVTLSGTLIIGGFLLVATSMPLSDWSLRRSTEMVTATLALVMLGWILRASPNTLRTAELLSLLLLAGVYRQRGAAFGALAMTGLDALLTLQGWSPFGGATVVARATQGSLYMAVAMIVAMMVAAAFSERRVADDAARVIADTMQQLDDAQRVGDIGSFIYHIVDDRIEFSPQAARIIGADRGMNENWAARWDDAIWPEDRPLATGAVVKVLKTSEAGSFTVRANRPDTAVQWVEVRLRVGDDNETDDHCRIHGTVQDITALKLAELQAQALFESVPYPILVVDTDGSVVKSNPSAEAMFNVNVGQGESLCGSTVDELLVPVDAPGDGNVPWYVSAVGDSSSSGLELWAQRRRGPKFPAEAFVSIMPTERGPHYSIGLRDTTKRREIVELLNFQARHDPLTELPNRMMFVEELEGALARARKSRKPLAVIFADVDNFKSINDSGGHEIGDLALLTTAGRLLGGIREGDLLARFGGDEFVIMCENLLNVGQARAIAQRLTDDIADEPFDLGGKRYQMSLSAGLLLVENPDEANVDSILRSADRAMYTAKVAGKRRVSVAPSRVDQAQAADATELPADLPRHLELVTGEDQAAAG